MDQRHGRYGRETEEDMLDTLIGNVAMETNYKDYMGYEKNK